MALRSRTVICRLDINEAALLDSLVEKLGAWNRAAGKAERMTRSKVLRKALACLGKVVRGDIDVPDLTRY